GLEQLDVDADVAELRRDVLRGDALADRGTRIAGVSGVDPEQVAADVDDLVGGGDRFHALFLPARPGPRLAGDQVRVKHGPTAGEQRRKSAVYVQLAPLPTVRGERTGPNVVDLIAREHRELLALCAELTGDGTDTAR